MIPTLKIGGTQALLVFLIVVVMFGAAHLAALSYPDAELSKAWILLGF